MELILYFKTICFALRQTLPLFFKVSSDLFLFGLIITKILLIILNNIPFAVILLFSLSFCCSYDDFITETGKDDELAES